MGDPYVLIATVNLVLSIFLILVMLGVAGIAVLRFKRTIAGVLLALGFGGFALIILVSVVAYRLMDWTEGGIMVFTSAVTLIDLVFTLVVAAGIAVIPRSLRTIKASMTRGG